MDDPDLVMVHPKLKKQIVYLCYPKPMDDRMIINFPKMTTFIRDPSSILSQKSLHFHSVGYIHMKLSILTRKPHKIAGFHTMIISQPLPVLNQDMGI